MLVKLTHTTDLSYTAPITESVMELRMTPRQEQDQHRLSFSLAIGPNTHVSSYFDWLGNTVHAFTIKEPHQHIRIVATSVVEVDRLTMDPREFADRWPLSPRSFGYDMHDFLQLDGPVTDCPELRQLAADLRAAQGDHVGALALGMIEMLGERFTYERGVTTAASPITDILRHGRGVCQDFTHLMIGLARVLGIPARYVSGAIHNTDAVDDGPLQGAAETHAWCELYFPSAGWIGFDPANRCVVGRRFVKTAIGRDFRDVTPNRGVYRGNASESIVASVHTEELPSIPPALAPERYESLRLDARSESLRPLPVMAGIQDQQQHEQEPLKQQQQQQQQ
jgi:transglutaminase-like putative cysteine protease